MATLICPVCGCDEVYVEQGEIDFESLLFKIDAGIKLPERVRAFCANVPKCQNTKLWFYTQIGTVEFRNHDELFEIYLKGPECMSVCVHYTFISRINIRNRCNKENPTGIKKKWMISKDNFSGGEKNPYPCNINPDTHLHYLLKCK